MRFTKTSAHAPEPGIGGASYEVRRDADGEYLGLVRSTWNRTNGVHWTAETPDGAEVMSGRAPRAFESRKRAAYALAHEFARAER